MTPFRLWALRTGYPAALAALVPGKSAVDLIEETALDESLLSWCFRDFLCLCTVGMGIMVRLSVNSESILVGSVFEFFDDLYQT